MKGVRFSPLELKRELPQLDLTEEDEINASGTALQGKHTAAARELHVSFELGEKNWKIALSDAAHTLSRYTVTAGDTGAVLECVAKAKERSELAKRAKVQTVMKPGAMASGCTAGCTRAASTTS